MYWTPVNGRVDWLTVPWIIRVDVDMPKSAILYTSVLTLMYGSISPNILGKPG
jgi:hypothetical protein